MHVSTVNILQKVTDSSNITVAHTHTNLKVEVMQISTVNISQKVTYKAIIAIGSMLSFD